MREKTEYYVLPMQSAGYEQGFDPVMIEPIRFRGYGQPRHDLHLKKELWMCDCVT